jgi:hypothetical protein
MGREKKLKFGSNSGDSGKNISNEAMEVPMVGP